MVRRSVMMIVALVLLGGANLMAQPDAEATYDKFLDVTSLLHGEKPYSCYAVLQVKYSSRASDIFKDTSRLIYKNGSTYYKSPLVERVEASQGELLINHQLKTASFRLSDSITHAIQKELNVKPNKELEALLDSNFASRDEEAFRKYVISDCKVVWNAFNGLDEISFVPKNTGEAPFLSIIIRFDRDSRIRYYEYTTRSVYATDLNGNSRAKVVTTIYDDFNYDNVPNIPSKLSDFLEWDGWTIKLKRYSNYKLSLL